jgi:hypothetical protein
MAGFLFIIPHRVRSTAVNSPTLTLDSLIRARGRATLLWMFPGAIFDRLSPYARVMTAILPFLAAIVCRLMFGKNRVTRALLSISTIWFALNVFLAPYSYGMRQDLVNLRRAVFR